MNTTPTFSLVPVAKFKGPKTCIGGIGKNAAFKVAGTTLLASSLLVVTDRGPVGFVYTNGKNSTWWSGTTPEAGVPKTEDGWDVSASGSTPDESARALLHRQSRMLARV